ncbi:MAG: hypothetical protein PHQ52_04125 [Candidatus Omnitrophica bacterium]|nr:hypothetical protein [Candidatus Omnitrophota bacterium]
MKKYLQPKIRAVKLDAEQTVLQVCKVGGAYFVTAGNICQTGQTGRAVCGLTVRGKAYEADNLSDFEWSSQGS